MGKPDYHRRKLAFTLPEVLMAVLVVGLVLGSLYRGIGFAFDQTKSQRENLRATQIMLQRLEGIRLFNWDQLTDTTLNPQVFYESYVPAMGGVPAGSLYYTGRLDVASVTLDPPASYSSNNMKKVTVTVTWSSSGALRTRSASTYVARHGVQNYVFSN